MGDAAQDDPVWPALRALRHRNFRLYGGGLMVSLIGTWMQSTAQSWLVYRLTKSNLLLGTTQFAGTIPVLFLSPIAGLIADRYSRRSLILTTQTLFMLQAAALAALTLGGAVTVPWVILLAALGGIVNAFDIPSRQSFLPELVGRQDLMYAIALNSLAFQVARVAGPAAGGWSVAMFGEGICFALNAVSYIAVIAGLLRLRLAPAECPEPDGSHLGRLAEGFRYVFATRQLASWLGLSALMNIFVSPVFVLGPEIAEGLFHRGPTGFGNLTGALGVGAIAGMLVLASRQSDRGLNRLMAATTGLTALSLAALAFVTEFWMALALMPLVGFSYMTQNAMTNTAVQKTIPDGLRGRIMGIYTMTVAGMIPIGSLLSGWCAEAFGPRLTLFSGGAGVLLGGLWFAWRQRGK